MKKIYLILMAVLSFSMAAQSLDITINDGYGTGTGWYSANRENQEVEPGNVAGQVWDMESFVLNGSILTMTGGYNFTKPSGYGGFRPGDLFFDVDGVGFYDFVAVIGDAASTYNVYYLDDNSNTYDVFYSQNIFSNPWKYKDGGTLIKSGETALYGSFSSEEGIHYTLDIDLSWLENYLMNGDTVTLHYTMECGNDNLMGQYIYDPVPDAGNSLAMMGVVAIALYSVRRSRKT
jgi:hypothetical protein